MSSDDGPPKDLKRLFCGGLAWATSEERAKAAEAGATAAVEFALVSLQGKKKSAIESDLERLDMRVDQLPAYRWYRGGEPWDWCRNASFPPFVC